ncbi:glycosyltransferase family 4 protein [Uliginosibacterium sp. 31-16]|uniref:glycosyltransferase family 4 protein n=1 Tax=Uliginosibacterium sp. 31-16 TaxID=3068315 RepID=UPI00273DE8A1|nr:glycosyltransferase family 4 protein [Uliginosibacterium sp. 31-16]MDP5238377.1 glycosyltransferase family 4 protein [Uliginosibacterium sp. 31-16]
MGSRKLLFFVTEDWYFCSHRLPLGVAARAAGYDVVVVTRVREHGERITAAGLRLIPFEMSRRSANPLAELGVLWRLWRVYRTERPDIVHHVSLKPVLYGSLVAKLAGMRAIVNAMAGLGILFSSDSSKARLLRPLVKTVFRLLLGDRRELLILQNQDNVAEMTEAGIVPAERIRLVRGAGVDLAEFAVQPEPSGVPRILLVARMLWDKGVGDFVAAARLLHERGVVAECVLVGEPDVANPAAIPLQQLRAWHAEGVVRWLGRREDVAALYAGCHIACLPSFYGEGIPKSLLEAAASGRAIVTTDAPGCREVVQHEGNGLLVPVRDPAALADAFARLVSDAELRQRMGRVSRERAEQEFALALSVQQTLDVYTELLPG